MDVVNAPDASPEEEIVTQPIRPRILGYSSTPSKLKAIIEPLRGFRWDRKMRTSMGAEKINGIMSRIKRSNISHGVITQLRRLYQQACYDQPLIPPYHWGPWRWEITRYNPYEIPPFHQWSKIATHLGSIKILFPINLADLISTGVSSVGKEDEFNGNLGPYGRRRNSLGMANMSAHAP